MDLRRTIVLAAVALLASRVAAEGASEPRHPPADRPETSGGKDSGQKARELGQRGSDAVKRGASGAREKLNQGGQAAAAKVVGTRTVTGRIASVSPDQVTVKGSEGEPLKLRITPSTKVTLGGKDGSVGSLRAGDEVRASYAQSGGSATATKLEVKRAPASRSAGAGAPPGARSR